MDHPLCFHNDKSLDAAKTWLEIYDEAISSGGRLLTPIELRKVIAFRATGLFIYDQS